MKTASNTKTLAKSTTRFVVIGLNYIKADADTRGRFSLPDSQQIALLETAKLQGITSLSIISTCNRTELYGFAASADPLIELLCSHTQGTKDEFLSACYLLLDIDKCNFTTMFFVNVCFGLLKIYILFNFFS